MLYDCDNPILKVIGVEHLKWGAECFVVPAREYSAIAFRINGTATITAGKKEYYVNANDVLYLPQNLPYVAQYSDTELIVIHFVTERDDKEPQVYSLSNTEKIYKAFLNAHTMWQNKVPGYLAYVTAELYKALAQICEQEAITELPVYFINVLSYINSKFKDNGISIGNICKFSGISATNLRLLFKKHYQKTPLEYINELRLEYARNLISCGVSVENAALESGFNDPKYFARVVKKHFGCTPRELKIYGK